MLKKATDAVKEWFAANKLGLLGFSVGMVFVFAIAGMYRISWEFPESDPIPNSATITPKTAVTPTPARASQTQRPTPQRPMRAKPTLKRLDGPPEALRRLHEQQNKAAISGAQPNTK